MKLQIALIALIIKLDLSVKHNIIMNKEFYLIGRHEENIFVSDDFKLLYE